MDLGLLVKTLTNEALEFIFTDAMNRCDDENARIISDELFERRIRYETL